MKQKQYINFLEISVKNNIRFFKHIAFNFYGIKICIHTNEPGIFPYIQRVCFPFLKSVPAKNNPDLSLYFVFIRKNKRNTPRFQIKTNNSKKYCNKKDKFFIKNGVTVYIQRNLGLSLWNSKTAYSLLSAAHFPINSFKYLLYTIFSDLLIKKGYFWIHSCGLSLHNKGILLLGDDGSGKSTLALRLIEKGFQCLGDNVIILKKGPTAFYMLPFLKYISVKKEDARCNSKCLSLLKKRRFTIRTQDKFSFITDHFQSRPYSNKTKIDYVFFINPAKRKKIIIKKIAAIKTSEYIYKGLTDMFLGIMHNKNHKKALRLSIELANRIKKYEIYNRNKNLDAVSGAMMTALKDKES